MQNDVDLSQVGNTFFNWTRASGATETSNTGPSSAVDGDFMFTQKPQKPMLETPPKELH